ncbi:hypothetical protein MSAN_01741200 [Mycena sanguinolenta]|uniref:Uncharacterized protein n=1 Tax=Mycena sanguinolenta TaxID=230812 RepID=A0A8H6XXQ2_9AGAR|nr:hypothetical protein MSAN_01741200 [Mycena sanguinolenta]
MWDAWQEIDDSELIKKSWKLCQTKEWDLSYECLTSFRAREALRQIKVTDRDFWEELEGGRIRALEEHNEEYPDDPDPMSTSPADDDETLDGCEISSRRVKRATMESAMEPLTSENNRAETLDDVEEDDVDVDDNDEPISAEVPGKRTRKPTTRYAGFWRHRDDVHWESDEEFS